MTSGHGGWWFSQNKGKLFKRPNGRVAFRVEDYDIDTTYLSDYNFVNTTIKMVNTNTGKAKWMNWNEVVYWTPVEEPNG